MLKAVAAVGLALSMTLPNLAAKAESFMFPDFGTQTQADDSLRGCLILSRNNYETSLDEAKKTFNEAVALARTAHKRAIDEAWRTREASIKSGRVSIALYDDSGRPRENKKAERSVFELTKSEAETDYENAKKTASAAWKSDYKEAAQALDAARQDAKDKLLSDKNRCIRLTK